MRLLLSVTLALLLFSPASAHAGCLKSKESTTIIEGVLSEGTFAGSSGDAEKALILTPLVPTCLAGDDNVDESETVGELQIFSSNDDVAKTLKDYVGHDVFVQGTPFGANSEHHHVPIVMDITSIQIN